ncbi:hypothetical protein [Kribbella jiaozuonensis]|uniref:Uncharacterized protein n=1 Tax=Kribbella jiaozuonensis TaxID=2575441 RepID=A0A4U3LWA4_9ACTN|nr:hypothetical protein [Kribbella jiaozuonensis]TKK79839.1 hypothetical protein FDA38_15840 [Kribbella jiaozuonensis]
MAASQAVALVLIVVLAYYIVSYRRQLAFLIAIVVISVFLFGAFTIAELFHGEPFAASNEFVQKQSTSQQR